MTPEQHREATLVGYASMGADTSKWNVVNRTTAHSILTGTGVGIWGMGHPNETFLSNDFKRSSLGKKRKKRMSTKFIVFDSKLVNVGEVKLVVVHEPKDPSQKVSVKMVCDTLHDMNEYFDSLADAQTRFTALQVLLSA